MGWPGQYYCPVLLERREMLPRGPRTPAALAQAASPAWSLLQDLNTELQLEGALTSSQVAENTLNKHTGILIWGAARGATGSVGWEVPSSPLNSPCSALQVSRGTSPTVGARRKEKGVCSPLSPPLLALGAAPLIRLGRPQQLRGSPC